VVSLEGNNFCCLKSFIWRDKGEMNWKTLPPSLYVHFLVYLMALSQLHRLYSVKWGAENLF